MVVDRFNKRKSDILSKSDKSSKQSWDKKISDLCEEINRKDNFYTTSSCAGRIVLMIDQEKKQQGLFLKTYHDLTDFDELKKDLNEIAKKNKKPIKFKSEPCIMHVACREIEEASELCEKARLSGWKKSGIISFGKRIIVELSSTEKLEFPIIENDKILVDDYFLKTIIKKANEGLKRSWEKIQKLKSNI